VTDRPALPGLDDLDVAGRRVFVRCDFNVPLADGEITDDLRIRSAVPTLQRLLDKGARLVVASHLGRPKGKVVPELSLTPVGARLAQLIDREVPIAEDVAGQSARALSASDADVVLLENLRFEPGEENSRPSRRRT
jgi:phosphoglycerate kinase